MSAKDAFTHTSLCSPHCAPQTVSCFISPGFLSRFCSWEAAKPGTWSCFEGGDEPLHPVLSSAQRLMLFCGCRYSVPPEHGKRLERLAKGTVSPPQLAQTLLRAVLMALRVRSLWSDSHVSVLRPAGGGLARLPGWLS